MDKRSNPHACPTNAIKLHYSRAADEKIMYANIGYVVASDGSTIDITILNSADADYLKVVIKDKNNKTVNYRFKPAVAQGTTQLYTSGLDNGCKWTVFVYAAIDGTTAGCDGAKTEYSFEICQPKGASGDTIPVGVQGIFPVLTDNGSTSVNWDPTKVIAYGETYDLGAYSNGDDLLLLVDLYGNATQSEIPHKDYKTFAATATGDVTSATNVTFPAVNTLRQITALVLETTVGSKAAEITFTGNDNAYEVYKFTLTWTVS